MATIQEVAQLAGVSVGSVSRFLNGYKLKEKNEEKIKKAIKELDYQENYFAKSLKTSRTHSIGLLMNNAKSMFSSNMTATLGDELEQLGYSMLLSGYHEQHTKIDVKMNFLLSRKIDGLIIFEPEEKWKSLDLIKKIEIPILSINTSLTMPNVDSIVMDNRTSTKTVVTKMIDFGHKKIGIIAGPDTDSVAKERLSGAIDAAHEQNFSEENLKIVYGDYSKQSGQECMQELLEEKVTSVFVCNYNMSLGALQAIYEAGIAVGSQLSFANFAYFETSDIFRPRLTSICQPVDEISKYAAQRIVKRIQSNNSLETEVKIMHNDILWHDSIRRFT